MEEPKEAAETEAVAKAKEARVVEVTAEAWAAAQ